MNPQDHREEREAEQLDALFAAYREISPDPEPSADFMPRLWQKIEAREQASTVFGRLARNLVTAALALSSILAIAVSISHSRMAQLPNETYVEILAEHHARESMDYVEPIRFEPVADRK